MNPEQLTEPNELSERSLLLNNLRNALWLLGASFWLFGITDRGIASLGDGYLSALDIGQLVAIIFFFMNWLFLKPSSLKLRLKNPN
ncbi:MAG TPA: hypothetical protein V6C78_31125 [Crinalium sp.]|jgi:hypothetical protein